MATARQRKAVDKLVENGGKSVSKAMRDAGYSPATAENPDKLTKSKGWQELMDQYLPDNLILKSLADDIMTNPGKRVAELSLAAKLKGRLVDKAEVKVKDITDVLDDLDDDVGGEARKALDGRSPTKK